MSWKDSLPASRAQKRYICPGSHYLESLYREETSASTEEGILAHEIAANRVKHLFGAHTLYHSSISEEMDNSIDLYVADICREYKKPPQDFLNDSFYVPAYDSFYVEASFLKNGGFTSVTKSIIDCYLIRTNANERQIIIWDFKYGHKNVEAVNNLQLLNYAMAIYNNTETPSVKTTFILKIIQPRVFNGDKIKIWELDEKDLLEYREDIVLREILSLTDNAPRFVSEECFTCRARHACPTLREASLNSIAISSGHSPYSLPAEEVGQELKILEHSKQVLDARINGLKQQALQYLKQGKRVNFYELQQAMSRLSWDASPQKLKGLEQLTGVSLVKQNFVTPKQAIDSGIPVDIVLKYASRKPGEIKIVPQSESQLTKIFNPEN